MSDLLRPARAVLLLTAASMLAACGQQAEANQRPHRMRSITSARQVQGEKTLDVRVQYGFGTLQVQPATGDLLYRMDLRYDDQQFRPVSEYDRAAGRLRLGVEGRERGARGERGGDAEAEHASISLAPSVPMDLSLQFGAGKTEAELGGMALNSLSLQTGASNTVVAFSRPNRVAAREVNVQAGAAELRLTGLGNTRAERFDFQGGVGQATLDFSGAWDRNATARVRMGVGAVRLRLPRSLGVRVTKSSFLSSFDPTEMVKQGDAWYSRNWSQAAHKLEISIDAAVGSIDVDWVD